MAYYSIADVFALPSHSEGSPNALLEAMAAGVPIVSCKVGGVPETVEDGSSALLVPPANPSAMANAIARVLKDPELAARLASNASERLSKLFSPESRYQAFLQVYRASKEGDQVVARNAHTLFFPPPVLAPGHRREVARLLSGESVAARCQVTYLGLQDSSKTPCEPPAESGFVAYHRPARIYIHGFQARSRFNRTHSAHGVELLFGARASSSCGNPAGRSFDAVQIEGVHLSGYCR